MTKFEQVANWEWDILRGAFEDQGEEWEYSQDFRGWYNEVFLVEEGWSEIRAEAKS